MEMVLYELCALAIAVIGLEAVGCFVACADIIRNR